MISKRFCLQNCRQIENNKLVGKHFQQEFDSDDIHLNLNSQKCIAFCSVSADIEKVLRLLYKTFISFNRSRNGITCKDSVWTVVHHWKWICEIGGIQMQLIQIRTHF